MPLLLQMACVMFSALAANVSAQEVEATLLRRAMVLCQDTDCSVRQVLDTSDTARRGLDVSSHLKPETECINN